MDEQSRELLGRLSQAPTAANLAALRTHCQRTGEQSPLAQGLTVLADAEPDGGTAAGYLVEAAQLQWQLGDLQPAREGLERALSLWPTHAGALALIRELYLHQSDHAALAQALETFAHALAEQDGDPVELGALHLELGHLWRDHLQRLDRAVAHYRTAVDFDAAQREAIRAARDIYRQVGKWESVARLLGLEAESYPAGQKKATLFVELATLHRERLNDLAGAQRALEEAARTLPDDLGIKHQLALLHLNQSDRAPHAPEAPAHRFAAADILATMAEAVEDDYALAYTEAALDAAPGHARALAVYEQVARRAGCATDIPGRWVQYLQAAGDDPEARRVRLGLAHAYLEAGQAEDAELCLEPLLRVGDPDARSMLSGTSSGSAPSGVPADRTTEAPAPPADYPDEDVEELSDVGGVMIEDTDAAAEPRGAAAAAETRPHAALSADEAASALTPSLEQTLSEMDFEELPGERTPVSVVPPSELARLRDEMHRKLGEQDRAGAAETARLVLAKAPLDTGALTVLEEHYRAERDFARLREVVWSFARLVDLPIEARIQRLREAATLSEARLEDPDGTIEALSAILTLVPSDEAALERLRSLLGKHERWDELAQLLEREAAGLTDTAAQVEAYRELVTLHRDKRGHLEDAIDALRYLRDLEPDAVEHEEALAELLLQTDQPAEAVPLLEAQLLRIEEPGRRGRLLRQLAELYEHRLQAPDRAYEVLQAALRLSPDDEALLDRLVRMDEASGRSDRLVENLQNQLSHLDGAARAALHVRIAGLAAEQLRDPALACEHYASALALTPEDEELWDRARGAFEASGRDRELTELVSRQAEGAADPVVRARLLRRLSARLAQEGDLDGAIAALDSVVGTWPDDMELRSELVELLEQHGQRPETLAEQLQILARSTAETAQHRELLLRRAEVLHAQLGDAEEARAQLWALAEETPRDEEVLERLAQLCEQMGDAEGSAEVLERKLGVGETTARIAAAQRLVELALDSLDDAPLARTALFAWADLAPEDTAPRRKLLALLNAPDLAKERLSLLDELARLEPDEDERVDYLLQAAATAEDPLADFDGAWRRLVAAAVDLRHAAAEEALHGFAERQGRGAQLAELYVGLAQREQDAHAKLRRWMDAAQAYEELAGDHEQALEASLRALALDLGNAALLDEADRLAAAAGAFERLSQVYTTLARKAESDEARLRVLRRHTALLERNADDPGAALDCALRACRIAPADEELLHDALRLAERTARQADVLEIYALRARAATDAAARTRSWLAACALCHRQVGDPERTRELLRRAALAALRDAALLDEVDGQARELDQQTPPEEGPGLVEALAGVYEQRAGEDAEPALVVDLLRRAARGRAEPARTFENLLRALDLAPQDAELLEEVTEAAEAAGTYPQLAERLQTLADQAIDSKDASLLLRRLARLLTGPLQQPVQAADVLQQLVRLQPDDEQARETLRECLRAAGRHQELLMAIDQQLPRTDDPQRRLALLKEAARCWEHDLRNRAEARDAWRKVLREAPEDGEATAAVAILSERPPAEDEGSLLDPAVTVTAEDLVAATPEDRRADGNEAATLGEGLDEDTSPDLAAAPQPTAAEPSPDPASLDEEPVAETAAEADAATVSSPADPAADSHAREPLEQDDWDEVTDSLEVPTLAESAEQPREHDTLGEGVYGADEEDEPTPLPRADDGGEPPLEHSGIHATEVTAPGSLEAPDDTHAVEDRAEAALDVDDEEVTGVASAPPPPPPPSQSGVPERPQAGDPLEALAALDSREGDELNDDLSLDLSTLEQAPPTPSRDAEPPDESPWSEEQELALDDLSELVTHERPRSRSYVPPPPPGRGAVPPAPPTTSRPPPPPRGGTSQRLRPVPPPPKPED